ncbi:AraC family transcriptional regulator [Blastococcus xanthinilyticus]|uniref:AraC family transcriptional regulator n=1 Tax=Blastococcus xanthinilyticus TaxID=1564164 RepID=A0A5S5D0X4_9ACTN|nr:AraC family transcriptional regulator [Blastococcus xanthinilyticus]TYP88994.1 AraC family transcriptional regulator [Blastococcus xanthinilyticus]
MTTLLDTDLLPATERLDAVHAVYEGQSPRRSVVVGAGPVRHRVERLPLGPDVHLLQTGGSALRIVRTPRQVRADAPEHVAIGLHRRGAALVSTAGTDADIPVGHLNCVDMTRPYDFVHRTANSHDVLILGNRQVGVSVDVVRAAAPALPRSPVYHLVRGHVAGLYRAARGLGPEHRSLTGQATAALVRALLTTAAQSRGMTAAMDDALEARIALYLDAHLADRDLTVERVAAAHAISVRHLYDVWARAGHERTPAQWIGERRLQRARERLRDPDAGRTSIGVVARQSGFPDSSHFSRRFRERFGVSPTEWRAAGGRAASR